MAEAKVQNLNLKAEGTREAWAPGPRLQEASWRPATFRIRVNSLVVLEGRLFTS